jgi:2-desacetyl-2-hydroxyethyl bacteriochlorophyllide A dehydrogenase
MKAVVFRRGHGLVAEEVPTPAPAPDQVLIRVANTGFCGSDHTLVESGNLPDGCILGHETSGTVAEVGSAVAGVRTGTRVIVRPTFCGACADCHAGRPYFCQNQRRTIGIGDLPGAFAEYVTVYPQMLIPVPDGVDSRNAALAEAFAASLHGISCTGERSGSALVIGGGPIGLALVRLLKIHGFGPVVLSEPVAAKREIGRAFGADAVCDPLAENLGLYAFQQTRGLGFATVFECAGVPELLETALNACARGGTVCVVSVMGRPAQLSTLILNFKEVWLTGAYSNTHAENIRCLEWMAEGMLDGRPLITDLIPLERLPEVYRERIHPGQTIKVMLQIGKEF